MAIRKKGVSVIITSLNEDKNLRILYRKINNELKKRDYYNYEIIFIDDGSTDKTEKVLKEIIRTNPKVKAIFFDKNYGKTRAIEAGVNLAKSDIVVTMDADLQHDPKEIHKLVEKIQEGYDVVTGQRINRDDSFVRMFFSRGVNFLLYKFTGFKAKDFYCGFKAFKRKTAKDLGLFSDLYRFVAFLAYQKNLKTTEIPIMYLPRKHGKSKYGFGIVKRA